MKKLRGQVALITGAASGLGAGLARACAAAGMQVVVSDVREAALARVAGAIAEAGGAVVSQVADVLDSAATEALVASTYERCGGLDLLINNAGVMTVSPLAESTDEDWSWLLGVNLLGAVRVVSAAVPRMRVAGGEAHIVNVASMSGLAPALDPPVGTYAASKSALITYSEVLAHELEADGIAVSVACPGGMATEIFEAERHRPKRHRPAGFERQPAQGTDILQGMMSPDEAARRILAGIRHGHFYIFTHPDQWERLQAHWDRLRSDFEAARDAVD
jgi:NAD(P)-dependent dehydrogenase (short-subunit alcohol dehydrogenase family)